METMGDLGLAEMEWPLGRKTQANVFELYYLDGARIIVTLVTLARAFFLTFLVLFVVL